MMKIAKINKVINIIIISIIVLCAIGCAVGYIWFREPTVDFFKKVMIFINQPLPVAGVSILLIGKVFISVISRTAWGQRQIFKINEIVAKTNENIDAFKTNYENNKSALNDLLKAKENEIQELKAYIVKICETMPNKKIKQIGVEIKNETHEKVAEIGKEIADYGKQEESKETIDIKGTTEEI